MEALQRHGVNVKVREPFDDIDEPVDLHKFWKKVLHEDSLMVDTVDDVGGDGEAGTISRSPSTEGGHVNFRNRVRNLAPRSANFTTSHGEVIAEYFSSDKKK